MLGAQLLVSPWYKYFSEKSVSNEDLFNLSVDAANGSDGNSTEDTSRNVQAAHTISHQGGRGH